MTLLILPVDHVKRAFNLPDDCQISGVKLSLDGRFLEARVELNQAPMRVGGGIWEVKPLYLPFGDEIFDSEPRPTAEALG